jgi:HK97 family phage major capsid protein
MLDLLEKLKACKSEDEKYIQGLTWLKEEAEKTALERDNAKLAQLKTWVDDAGKDFEKRLAERFPQFSLPGLKVGDDTKKDQFSFARAAIAHKRGDWSIAPYEGEVYRSKEHQDFIQKAASFGIDAAGGFLVPNEVSSKFIERLLAQTIGEKLGVIYEDVGNTGMLAINRETGSATAEWAGEMATAARSQVTLGQMQLTPHAVSAKGDISNLLQLLGSGAAESRFIRSASRQMALAWDRAILIGANSALGPLGVVNTLGVNTSSSVTPTYDKYVDFETAIMTANAYFGKLAWAMSVSQYALVRKLKDTAGQPMILRSLEARRLDAALGHPLYTTTQMGTTGANTLIFGAWDMCTLYRWFGGIMINRSTTSDTAIDSDVTRVALRALLRRRRRPTDRLLRRERLIARGHAQGGE